MSEEKDNVYHFITKCNVCKREIPGDTIYYAHPKHGFVCEYCPEFNDGEIKLKEQPEDENI